MHVRKGTCVVATVQTPSSQLACCCSSSSSSMHQHLRHLNRHCMAAPVIHIGHLAQGRGCKTAGTRNAPACRAAYHWCAASEVEASSEA